MAASNEDFLKDIERDYPGVNWDDLPPIEDAPDVFIIRGEKRSVSVVGHKYQSHFQIDGEYESREEAEAVIAEMKENPLWSGTLWETVVIEKRKPDQLEQLHLIRDLREDVLKGDLTFPILGP